MGRLPDCLARLVPSELLGDGKAAPRSAQRYLRPLLPAATVPDPRVAHDLLRKHRTGNSVSVRYMRASLRPNPVSRWNWVRS
jgi:hypothetical protein